MTHEDCPRFNSCNAAICPLDPAWRKAVHLHGEPVCFYLLNIVKKGANERFKDDPVAAAVLAVADEVQDKHKEIANRVAKASQTPPRGAFLMRRRGESKPETTKESA